MGRRWKALEIKDFGAVTIQSRPVAPVFFPGIGRERRRPNGSGRRENPHDRNWKCPTRRPNAGVRARMPDRRGCGARADRLQRGLEQSASVWLGEDQHDLRADPVAIAEIPRSDELLLQRRDAVHLSGLRAALRLSLPEAPLRARRARGRGGGAPDLPRQGRQGADRRRARRRRRGDPVHRQVEAGHQVRAASGVRQGCERRIRLSQHEARGRRRQAQDLGLQGDGHARARRRRLCVRRSGGSRLRASSRRRSRRCPTTSSASRSTASGSSRPTRSCASRWHPPTATCRSSISGSTRSRARKRSTSTR